MSTSTTRFHLGAWSVITALALVLAALSALSWNIKDNEVPGEAQERFFLSRSTLEVPDRIYQNLDSHTQLLFESQFIQEYTITGNSIIVVTLEKGGTRKLYLLSLITGGVEEMMTLEGDVEQLKEIAEGVVGFVYTTPDQEFVKTLVQINLIEGRNIVPVRAFDSAIHEVLTWFPRPGIGDMIVHTYDSNAFVVSGGSSALLGRYYYLGGLSPDGRRAISYVDEHKSVLNLDTLTFSSISTDTEVDAQCQGEVIALNEGAACLVSHIDPVTNTSYDEVVKVGETGATVLYSTQNNGGQVLSLRAESHGRALLLGYLGPELEYLFDNYPFNPRVEGEITIRIDLETGELRFFSGTDFRER